MACTDHNFTKSAGQTSPVLPLHTADRSNVNARQSPSRTADLSNIFVQMNEFSRLESPMKAGSSLSSGIARSSSPSRLRSPSGPSALSVSVISNLHSVLSLPSNARQLTSMGSKGDVSEKPTRHSSDCTNFQAVVDGNKNCIPGQSCDMEIESESFQQDDVEIPTKRKRLLESAEVSSNDELRQRYCNDRWNEIRFLNGDYIEHVTELFFLQNGGNLMDYHSWKKRPNTLLACYLRSECLDDAFRSSSVQTASGVKVASALSDGTESTEAGLTDGTSFDHHTSASLPEHQETPTVMTRDECESWSPFSSMSPSLWSSPATTSCTGAMTRPGSGIDVVSASDVTPQESIAELARQEAQVMEKIAELRKKGMWSVRRLPKASEPTHAKAHWDYVLEEMQWLANDFAQERKWKKAGARKVARMVAKYFQDQQQRELKAEREDALKMRRIAGTLAKMIREFWTNIEKVVQYKQQSRLDEKRKKALDMHLSFIVDQTEKYSTWLTEGLVAGATVSTTVDQQPSSSSAAAAATTNSSEDVKPHPNPTSVEEKAIPIDIDPDDKDFEPMQEESTDDEETIEKDELEHKNEDRAEELAALQKESEMPLDELLKTLPPEIFLESPAKLDADGKGDDISVAGSKKKDAGRDADKTNKDVEADSAVAASSDDVDDDDDDDGGSYGPCSDESSVDDEETLMEQEQHEQNAVDHAAELAALQEEENMPIEELLKRYGGYEVRSPKVRIATRRDRSTSLKSEDVKKEDDDEDETEIGTEFLLKSKPNNTGDDDDTNEELGTEFLLKSTENEPATADNLPLKLLSSRRRSSVGGDAPVDKLVGRPSGDSSPGREITDIAADAMSIQPTGYTLETAHVKTSVPFLIKHSLREYQHVGLDWLATMYEHRLNGILADEMGLGKTIQTIALLAYLACEKGIWGPHLIVVPTSVMLNWEMELKKWCPAFKILTYYGSVKERKMKRQGWTKTNAFHICITSYKLVIQDHSAFRRKKWKYFILDEAQNIKNFKSQRWQTLLNFHSLRRLLLTGTPLQNNLMELWSLMHFLMPHVFQSHRDFKEWFSNPLTGMIEGSREYNEGLVRRLHKVLRPFLLRRLKQDVEKQMPKKYEHVVMCRLSKRQRFLYDDFMSQAKTKETLATGHFMSVINILMQLRKVCNHPDLFDPRPTISPFHMEAIVFRTSSLVLRALESDPLTKVNATSLRPSLCDIECDMSLYVANRVRELATPRSLIVEVAGGGASTAYSLSSRDCQSDIQFVSTASYNRSGGETVVDTDVIIDNLDLDCGIHMSCTSSYPNFDSLLSTEIGDDVIFEQSSMGPVDVDNDDDNDEEWDHPRLANQRFVATGRRTSLRCDALVARRRQSKLEKLDRLAVHNARRCDRATVYGTDLHRAVDCLSVPTLVSQWSCSGYVHCRDAQHRGLVGLRRCRELFMRQTDTLCSAVLTPELHLERLKDVLDRFVFAIPPATAPRMTMHVSHPAPSSANRERAVEFAFQSQLLPLTRCLHGVTSRAAVQFPELRLIQYDCGKLQTLDILLRQLKVETHRVLIFTQMTRMLDVLEAFLSFHGHRYLRLDGTTKVEQRQALMERFNADRRIFCFILSTRSGGIGVNLTGADTVIFYDSDWNPTMDAQAQDRCHRIGQTRDVHIYRLISERTIEENILKKANEKRLLGNVAIEGGNFTTAFFKQQTIKDLFEEPSGLDSLTKGGSGVVKDEPKPAEPVAAVAASTAEATGLNDDLMEQALCAAEDESDIQAVKVAHAEAKAELAEFDEDIPWDEREQNAKRERDDESKVEIELAQLDKELMPVERYAVAFMEQLQAPMTVDELQKAEEEVSIAKEEWELNHLKALKQEEERRAEIEEDEMLYTSVQDTVLLHRHYKSKSALNKIKASSSRSQLLYSYSDWDEASYDDSMMASTCEDESIVDDVVNDDDFSDQSSLDRSSSFMSPVYAARQPLQAGRPLSVVHRHKKKKLKMKLPSNKLLTKAAAAASANLPATRVSKKKKSLMLTGGGDVAKRPHGNSKKRRADDGGLTMKGVEMVTEERPAFVSSENKPKVFIQPPLKPFKIPKIVRKGAVGTQRIAEASSLVVSSSGSYFEPHSASGTMLSVNPDISVQMFKRVPQQQQQPTNFACPGVELVRHVVGIRPRLVRLPPVPSVATRPAAYTTTVQRFAADSATGTVVQPPPRPPTPILEKFSASVLSNLTERTAPAPVQFQGVQYGSRLSQIVSSISAATMQTGNAVSGGATVQYIITTTGRPPQPAAANPTTLVMNQPSSQIVAGTPQPTSIVYQLPAGTAVGKRLQLQVSVPSVSGTMPASGAIRPQSVIIAQNATSTVPASQLAKPNYVITSQTGEKQSFLLLPTSNHQSFILAPAASVAQHVMTSQTTTVMSGNVSSNIILPAGFTLRQQQPPRPVTQLPTIGRPPLRTGQTTIIRANVVTSPPPVQPVVNTVPILEKFALQLNASPPPSVQTYQVMSGSPSPIKPQIVYSPNVGGGITSATSTSPQFVRFSTGSGGLNLKLVGGLAGSPQRLLNHHVVMGSGATTGTVTSKPVQAIDVSQLIIQQPSLAAVQTPYVLSSSGLAGVTPLPVVRNQLSNGIGGGTGTSILQVSGNQLSTVIILDSRAAAETQNTAKNN